MNTSSDRARLRSDFIQSMSGLASGVCVVTAQVEGRPWGMTITSCTSIAADPPTVGIFLRSDTLSARAIAETENFDLSILAASGAAVADYAARPGASKYLDATERLGDYDSKQKVIVNALSHLRCNVVQQVEIADHTLFVGRVGDVEFPEPEGDALVYHNRSYNGLLPHA